VNHPISHGQSANCPSYSEAIPILYETNIFDIRQPQLFLYLPQTILPERYHQIRFLEVTCYLFFICRGSIINRSDSKSWDKLWAVIATMQGLQRVIAKLYMLEHCENARFPLRPCFSVRHIPDFRVQSITDNQRTHGTMTGHLGNFLNDAPFKFEEILVEQCLPKK
jgi:hypothetical protein